MSNSRNNGALLLWLKIDGPPGRKLLRVSAPKEASASGCTDAEGSNATLKVASVEVNLVDAPCALSVAFPAEAAVAAALWGPLRVRAVDWRGLHVGNTALSPLVRIRRGVVSGEAAGAVVGGGGDGDAGTDATEGQEGKPLRFEVARREVERCSFGSCAS
eukprot:4171763-Pleurochrysis_carterae.AAC.1